MSLTVDMRQMVLVLANAVDLVGIDDVQHGRRVATIAVECAKHLGWDEVTQQRLFDAGLLHDCGVSSTRVHRQLVNELDWSGADLHCEKGAELLASFTPLAHLAPLVRYHHSHWRELSGGPVPPDTALLANLLYLADRVDVQAAPHYGENAFLLQVPRLRELVERHVGDHFAPELAAGFLEASRAEAFWLMLLPEFLVHYLAEMACYRQQHQLSLEELKQFAFIVADIIDAKSHFTNDHSLGVARLSRFLGQQAGLAGDHLDLLEVAALLHDIGKLQIPDDVLESPHRLSSEERALFKKHSFATFHILRRIGGLEQVAAWASQHHESLNGGGYPFHFLAGEIPLESRIIKVADVFQALAQTRPYRGPLPATEVLAMLRDMESDGEVDPQVVALVAQQLPDCHRIATVAPLPA